MSLTIACSRYIYNGVILHAHPVRGESHNQRNTTGEVATTSPPFYNEPHRWHVLCVKAELGTTSTSWSQHHFVACPSLCNTQARTVNLIHAILCDDEGVKAASHRIRLRLTIRLMANGSLHTSSVMRIRVNFLGFDRLPAYLKLF